MARITLPAAVALTVSGCSGPFFYHDVIVPTYGQVASHPAPAAAPGPEQPPAP